MTRRQAVPAGRVRVRLHRTLARNDIRAERIENLVATVMLDVVHDHGVVRIILNRRSGKRHVVPDVGPEFQIARSLPTDDASRAGAEQILMIVADARRLKRILAWGNVETPDVSRVDNHQHPDFL
ncbi:hypothetical protein BURPS406E_B0686 [Burkholderia pseudomallei 406e]|nr:hypothetical protein BURPS406E_B0686 [Burkholderia pseudomallei 406e]EDO91332.1 hypothetical protein BURPSPAST_Z0560 [Burkholderia pseudomallei Pasteur 52237]EDU09630.1 hypothetical protein BURPS1655_K0989 [Burkholderia pseudomallei 1655]